MTQELPYSHDCIMYTKQLKVNNDGMFVYKNNFYLLKLVSLISAAVDPTCILSFAGYCNSLEAEAFLIVFFA